MAVMISSVADLQLTKFIGNLLGPDNFGQGYFRSLTRKGSRKQGLDSADMQIRCTCS